MAEKYRRHNPYNYAVNNPVMFIDPDGNDVVQMGSGMMASGEHAALAFTLFKAMSPSTSTESGSSFFIGLGSNLFDNITVNKKGVISSILRNGQSNRFFDETGKRLYFNDSKTDDKYMLSQVFDIGDRLYYPISYSKLQSQITEVHHNNQLILMNSMDNIGSKFNSSIDLFLNSYNFNPGKGSDFTYNFLVPFLQDQNVNITNENLQDKFVPNAFFRFGDVNMIYNTFDAGNFMWGAWTKYIGLTAEKALWGARMNEFGNDSPRDQNAIWRGHKYFYKGTYKK